MPPIHSLELAKGGSPSRSQRRCHANEVRHLPDEVLSPERCALVRWNHVLGIYHKNSLQCVRPLPEVVARKAQDTEMSAEQFSMGIAEHLAALRAWKIRQFSFASQSAFRWCHGDADVLPGIVIDDYVDFVVLQSGNAQGDFLVPFVVKALESLDRRPLLERSSGQVRSMEGLPERTRWLRPPSEEGAVEVPFASLMLGFEPLRSQKTGLFLDQRYNLETFAALAAPLKTGSLLDICCYAGAWSAAGARAGLTEFTVVDADARALTMAERNIRRNATAADVSVTAHHGDLFELISQFKNSGRTWNAVVADPPAFAKSRKHIPEATRAYARLMRLSSTLVMPGGLLVLCSCSRNMEAATFEELAFRQLPEEQWVLLHRGQQSPDHTLTSGGSEYLKCLFFTRRGSL